MTTEQATSEQPTSGLAETMEAVFADIVGTPVPESKGDAAVIWYLKALQRLDKRRQDISETYKAMQTECAVWALAQTDSVDKHQSWLDTNYRHTVESVTRAKIGHSGKQKSFDFCYGVCSFKKQQDQWEWPDDEGSEVALIEWCRENCPEVLIITETVNKAELKKYVNSTGEEPPGVTITPGVEKFYVKPAPLALPNEQPKLLGKD